MTEDDSESMAERFETVHEHLDYVDRTLDGMAEEINELVDEVLEDTSIDISYDIDTGSFHGQLPYEEVTARLNERLDPPFFAKIRDGELVIKDVRREYDIDDLGDWDIQSDRDRTRSMRRLIADVEEQHEDGAPVEKVVSLAESLGLSAGSAKDEIQKMRQQGEVYEPANGHIRTT